MIGALSDTHIGIVFQSFHLVPTMTALENTALPLELAGEKDCRARAAAILDEVGLADDMTIIRRKCLAVNNSAFGACGC